MSCCLSEIEGSGMILLHISELLLPAACCLFPIGKESRPFAKRQSYQSGSDKIRSARPSRSSLSSSSSSLSFSFFSFVSLNFPSSSHVSRVMSCSAKVTKVLRRSETAWD